MTIEEKRRELFEAWFKSEFKGAKVRVQNLLGTYTHQHVELSWLAFSAALDAVVIELPQEDERGRITLTGAVRSIESTGLGLKVRI